MRNILNFHLNSFGWDDIGYNFCVGEDGNIYEGRGWHKQSVISGMDGFNEHSLSLCFIGNFDTSLPQFAAFLAVQELILCGIKKGYISSQYSLIAHRQLSPQNLNCPGNSLFNEIERNLKFIKNPNPITL